MGLRRDFIKIPFALAAAGALGLTGVPTPAAAGPADRAHFADGGSFDQVCARK